MMASPTQPPRIAPLTGRERKRAERQARVTAKRASGAHLAQPTGPTIPVVNHDLHDKQRTAQTIEWRLYEEARVQAAGGWDVRHLNTSADRRVELSEMHEVDEFVSLAGAHLLRDKVAKYCDWRRRTATKETYVDDETLREEYLELVAKPALALLQVRWPAYYRALMYKTQCATQVQMGAELGVSDRTVRTYITQAKNWLRSFANDIETELRRGGGA